MNQFGKKSASSNDIISDERFVAKHKQVVLPPNVAVLPRYTIPHKSVSLDSASIPQVEKTPHYGSWNNSRFKKLTPLIK